MFKHAKASGLRRVTGHIFLLGVLSILAVSSLPAATAPNAGMNDAWYDPATAGQGFFVDVYPDSNRVFILWFTFDSELPPQSASANLGGPGQRWYTAIGEIDSQNVAQLTITLTEDGVFNQSSPKPSQASAGTGRIEFNNCNNATFDFNLPDAGESGQIQLVRIVNDNVALCEYLENRETKSVKINRLEATSSSVEVGEWVEVSWEASGADSCTPSGGPQGWRDVWTNPNGGSAWFIMDEAGRFDFNLQCSNGLESTTDKLIVEVSSPEADSDFTINEGLNTSWYVPALAGQGFYVNVYPEIKRLFFSWFTFDTERPPASAEANIGEPGHRWLTAMGSYDGNTATLDVSNTTGGLFNESEPKPSVAPYGQITLDFANCKQAVMNYSLPAINDQGSLNIERIAYDNVPICEILGGEGDSDSTRSGLWAGQVGDPSNNGYAVCFYVSEDGSRLRPSTDCDVDQPDSGAYSFELQSDDYGTNQSGGNCGFGFGFEQDVNILGDSFEVVDYSFPGGLDKFSFRGTFNGNKASGTAGKTFDIFSCSLNWTAEKVSAGGTPPPPPPPPPSNGDIKGGLWEGTDICLYVKPDGSGLVPSYECDIDQSDNEPWSFEWQPNNLPCGISFPKTEDQEPDFLPINDGKFKYDNGWIAFEGTFNGDSVSGTARTPGCGGSNAWSATPR